MKKRSPLYREALNQGQSRTPADLLNQQRALDASITLANKAPVNVSSVVSSYDARPINAIDFYKIQHFSTFDGSAVVQPSLNFTVPDGKIAVLQTISWNAPGLTDVAPDGTFFNIHMRVDVIVDGNFDNQYQNIVYPIGIDIPIYVIANSGQLMQLQITIFGGAFIPFNCELAMYGQLLLASGRAVNYEAGTQYAVPVKSVE